MNNIRNLVTLAVFAPDGSARGAAHRHEPVQVVEIGEGPVTPGFVSGPIGAGVWTVALDVHCVVPSDVGGVCYTLDVVSDDSPATSTTTRVSVPVVVQERVAPRWLKGDLHVHSDHSDGRWTIDAVVEHVRRNNLDFVALTDHNTIAGTDALREALLVADLPTIVVPGLELTTFGGHANALGVEGWYDWRTQGPNADDGTVDIEAMVTAAEGDVPVPFTVLRPNRTMEMTARTIQAAGGLFVVNHPRSPGYPLCTGCHWDFDDAPMYADAIEVMNGDWPRRQNDEAMALWDRWLAAGWRVPATAGSDAHVAPSHPERVGYTWVHASPDLTEVMSGVRAGRSFLSRGPHLSWRLPFAGTELTRTTSVLEVEVRDVPPACELRLIRDGRVVSMGPAPEGVGVVAYPLHTRPTANTWFRVHLAKAGSSELLALTNPIWGAR